MTRALITGAAGGVGTALAQALDAWSYQLVLADRDDDGLERLAASLARPAHRHPCDLTERAEVAALTDRIGADPSDIDVLVDTATA